jgi:nucleoside triphosphatase
MRQRIIVCPLIQNDGAYLLCRMPLDRGVFPGQWALSGGGLEPGERIEEGLRREIREELGEALAIERVTPWTFRDDVRTKSYSDGTKEDLHMIYLIFDVVAANRAISFNDEFDAHAWVRPEDLASYDLNIATRQTLHHRGLLPAPEMIGA